MAREYAAKADALGKEAAADPPSVDRIGLPDIGRDDAASSLVPSAPESPAEC
jgi:hypothetical protein